MTSAPVRVAPPARTSQSRTRMPRMRTAAVLVALLALLAVSIVVAIGIGPARIAPGDVAGTLWAHVTGGHPVLPVTQDAIVWRLRTPRVLTAVVVGGGLAVCGAVMQALTRNPLADPYLLGLSSGASTGAVLVLVLGAAIALPAAAFAGAMIALVLTLGISRAAGGGSPTSTILAGLAVSAVLSALTSLVIFWSSNNDSYREILGWLLGSLSGADWADVTLAAIVMAACALPLLASARVLDSLALGDSAASALGVPVGPVRVALFGFCALLTGALVAVSGSVGFVGLILPHATRAVVGVRHRVLLPASFLVGAVFLLWADTIARTAFDPRELPVGIVTALIGGPVFVVLLMRMGRRRRMRA
ncbi:iron chelate uptake ABC transporter family permease subunit [Microbacterium sp. KUDC0406]|uniref:iron chelate uptake ABC transporter family permease subunit n=1 Tax=Microbacterium sp. KUDC0406 TaxID=2909588 RepID=UPI001F2F0E02|nr:iron chelate uptake ABC transporter family permease subunit [Microbacterium sp. KUDC0406]UJP09609.1 iron chelate uptake ABC transporter family permease subunit [Microbacterium sp. KUDC0406]